MEAADVAEKGLIVDMSGVDFIASVGIRALIRPSVSGGFRFLKEIDHVTSCKAD
jgi:hypothetical protein